MSNVFLKNNRSEDVVAATLVVEADGFMPVCTTESLPTLESSPTAVLSVYTGTTLVGYIPVYAEA